MTDIDLFDGRRRRVPAKRKRTATAAKPQPFPPDFETFWLAFPRRIGKLAAAKAYQKARSIADAQTILDGVERYKQHKPQYADWCHPSTFLNQGRWMDEAPQAAQREWVCPHTPKCMTSHWRCNQLTQIAAGKAK